MVYLCLYAVNKYTENRGIQEDGKMKKCLVLVFICIFSALSFSGIIKTGEWNLLESLTVGADGESITSSIIVSSQVSSMSHKLKERIFITKMWSPTASLMQSG